MANGGFLDFLNQQPPTGDGTLPGPLSMGDSEYIHQPSQAEFQDYMDWMMKKARSYVPASDYDLNLQYNPNWYPNTGTDQGMPNIPGYYKFW